MADFDTMPSDAPVWLGAPFPGAPNGQQPSSPDGSIVFNGFTAKIANPYVADPSASLGFNETDVPANTDSIELTSSAYDELVNMTLATGACRAYLQGVSLQPKRITNMGASQELQLIDNSATPLQFRDESGALTTSLNLPPATSINLRCIPYTPPSGPATLVWQVLG